MTRFVFGCFLLCLLSLKSWCQELQDVTIDSDITELQPMTGIVFWPGNGNIETDAIALEYSYMLYNEVVSEEGIYDWSVVEELLDEMASRNHQAVLRFRFVYPGRTTSVPDYIKELEDYNETEGTTEGKTTWFPDWTHQELQDFTIEFYEEYAEKYDGDPRLAFVQTGFGLWAEYHIYDGPFELGVTFPSKEFQESFFNHLNTVFEVTNWNISIDAASSTYSPFEEIEELKSINFGLFDDSFMHGGHHGYNTDSWNFFDRERYKVAPAGGEFSYYSTYDQQNVLNEHIGAYDKPFEEFVEEFHMSYINGNDQNKYQTLERIKQAGMYMGYRFKINSFKTRDGLSEIEIENIGVAPFYYDAFVAVNGVRATETLKLLAPGETLTVSIAAGGEGAELSIESDYILESQEIQFYGTINEPYVYVREVIEEEPLGSKKNNEDSQLVVSSDENFLTITSLTSDDTHLEQVAVLSLQGNVIYSLSTVGEKTISIDVKQLPAGVYIVKSNLGYAKWLKR